MAMVVGSSDNMEEWYFSTLDGNCLLLQNRFIIHQTCTAHITATCISSHELYIVDLLCISQHMCTSGPRVGTADVLF